MTELQFNNYTKLLNRAEQLQRQLSFMNTTTHSNKRSADVPVYELGWLSLSYGNGSWNHSILNNEDDVKEISLIIIKMLTKELQEVKIKMENV